MTSPRFSWFVFPIRRRPPTTGGKPALAPTRPDPGEKFNPNSRAAREYTAAIKADQADVLETPRWPCLGSPLLEPREVPSRQLASNPSRMRSSNVESAVTVPVGGREGTLPLQSRRRIR